jgi:tRNA dimethylallyltransferase
VGKTELSLALCSRFGGEILSADSRQIYRGMEIGTAKATAAEQAAVPHHLLDLRTPDQTLTVAEYQELAGAAIADIHARGRVPFLVGGTVLYLRAVTLGLRFPAVEPNPALRAELEERLARDGVDALADELRSLDPAGAARTDLRNPRRVLRALEIFRTTGVSQRDLEGADPPPWRVLQVGLTRPRPALYARIDARVDAMIDAGLVEETRRLLEAYDPGLPALTSLGFREIGVCLRGELSLADAVARIKTETHRYVRQQESWFRRMEGVHWFNLEERPPGDVVALVGDWLADGQDGPAQGE